MERKTLEITTGTLEQFEEETSRGLEKIEGGEGGSDKIYFEDPAMLRGILTEKRQELIQKVMESPPESIRELADDLDRGLREVHEDVHLLGGYKILTLEEEGNRKKPRIPYGRIHIEIDLPQTCGDDRTPAVT